MFFQDFVNDLKTIFKKPLPGREAQFQMIPDQRVKSFYDSADLISAKKGAVMVLFFQRNKDIIIPMIQRQHYDGVHSGQIAFPGGKKDPSDKDFLETALRETYEEIGIPTSKIDVIGKISELYIPPSNFLVQPFVGVLYEEPKYYPDLMEVADIYEFKVKDFLNPNCITRQSMTLFNGLKVSTPCFNVDNKIIWGGTAMMLNEMKVMLEQMNSPFLKSS